MAMGIVSALRRLNSVHMVVCAIILAGLSGLVRAEVPSLPGLAPVLDELRKGGLVIYLRHATTESVAAGKTVEVLARCETQRNLSAKGRTDATQIGRTIRGLGIPIGMVIASPYCRARDTAKLAFGDHLESPDLRFSMDADARETQRLAASLRLMLSTVPAPGKNTVLVSHSANLREAAGIFPKPEGVAIVFRPISDGRFEAIARISPEDWRKSGGLDQP